MVPFQRVRVWNYKFLDRYWIVVSGHGGAFWLVEVPSQVLVVPFQGMVAAFHDVRMPFQAVGVPFHCVGGCFFRVRTPRDTYKQLRTPTDMCP